MNQILQQLPETVRERLKRRKMPGFISPMKATLVHEHFSDPEWIFERKLDGERCLLHQDGQKTTLYSRNRKHKNRTYPEIANAVSTLGGKFIADAEIVTFDGKLTSFSRLQHRIHVKDPDEELLKEIPVYAYVFDILYLDGYALEEIPLLNRKSILRKALSWKDPLRLLPYRKEYGERYFRDACSRGWEGLIAKQRDGLYKHKRSKQWLKFKCGHQQELVIGGFTDPEGSRTGFGALLLGYHEKDELKYAGRVGTGFDEALLKKLRRKMAQMKRKTCPFSWFDESTDGVHWIRPKLVGEVGFTEWTSSGKLRHPRFLGLRDDKAPEDVVREDLES